LKDISFLFCCDYFDKSQPDEDYSDEYKCVREHDRDAYLFCLSTFLESGKLKIEKALRPTLLIYRGWMLTIEQYTNLYNALLDKNFTLINTPEQYRNCHHLPLWYEKIKNNTAKSVWTLGIPNKQLLLQILSEYENKPLIVKDYDKSRKHEWLEACFIPNASNTEQALHIIDTFVSRQDSDLVGGIVLREFLSLKMLGNHKKSDMPIAKEIRIFCINHNPFAYIQYWSGEELNSFQEFHHLIELCNCLDSNFYTIDIAQKTDGEWIIIEVGDGQVSGLQNYDSLLFYNNLFGIV
jgi:hypothetical protein